MSETTHGKLDRPTELAGTFDRIAGGYDARPGYPRKVFDILTERCRLARRLRVLEIGPGSGQATIPMLARGAFVTAVEPGEALARRLSTRLAGRRFDVIVSTFEDADLPKAKFDMVASATAFHWVDTQAGLDQAAHALVDGGWLALWWTIWRDPDRADPFDDLLREALRERAPGLVAEDAGPHAYIRDVAARAAEVAAHPAFGPVDEVTIRWDGRHDAVAMRRLFATFAAWIALPDDLLETLLDEVERLVDDHFGGIVTRPYRTVLYTSRRRPRASVR